ncbi:hypothetical protein N8964_00705 [Pontimonas sp.]|nr:hypothetical protein [Pontimonas sp.]
MSTEAITTVFGLSEISLRLLPFLAGCGALVLGAMAARKLFKAEIAQLVFLSILAFSPTLIHYSNETKQYSLEALVTVLVLWILASWNNGAKPWVYGILGFVATQFATTAILALAVLALILWFCLWRERRDTVDFFAAVTRTLPIPILWVAGAILQFLYVATAGPSSAQTVRNFWARSGGFPPEGGAGIFFDWTLSGLKELLWLSFGGAGTAVPGIDGPGNLALVLLIFSALGLFSMNRATTLGAGVIILSLLVATLGLYPFSSRLTIHLIPFVAAFAAQAVSRIASSSKVSLPRMGIVAGFAAVASPLVISLVVFGRPVDNADMRWLIEEVGHRAEPADVVTSPDELIVSWYLDGSPELSSRYLTADRLMSNPELVREKVVWLISSHYGDEIIIATLGLSHETVCESVIQGSRLKVLRPSNSGQATQDYCEFYAQKY